MDYNSLRTRFHYDRVFVSDPLKLNLLKLFQIGEICVEPGFEVERHQQFCHEISYIISGEGTFFYNSEAHSVKAGDIVITPKSGEHFIKASESSEITFAYIGFDFIKDYSGIKHWNIEGIKASEQLVNKDNSNIYPIFRRCMDEFYAFSEPNYVLIESCLVQIILLSFRETASNSEWRVNSHKNMGQIVYLILKYVDRNIEKSITVSGIAKSLGYSPYHISHIFKSKMHITIQDYIINQKIEKAKEYISLKKLSVTEISEKLGYLNIQSFSRSFKKKTGVSPSEYNNFIKR